MIPLITYEEGTSPGWTLADKKTTILFLLNLPKTTSLKTTIEKSYALAYSVGNAFFLSKLSGSFFMPLNEEIVMSWTIRFSYDRLRVCLWK